jgi:hypothetical protein
MKNRMTQKTVSSGRASGRAFKSMSHTLLICATAGLMFAGVGAEGQSAFAEATADKSTNTNTAPVIISNTPSITAPLATAEYWLTHFGTNTWSGTHGWIQTGAAYQNQLQFADALEVGLNLASFNTNSGLTLSDQMLNASIAGTIVSDCLDLSLRYDIKDVQIQFGAGPGYDKVNDKLFADLMAELQKKISANTHAYLRLDCPYEGKKSGLEVILGVGGEF